MRICNILKRLSKGLLAFILISPMLLNTAHAEGVEFECPILQSELLKIVGKSEIEISDLEALSGKLDLSYLNIKSLTGLEHIKNVEHLILSFNNITDLTPILGLKNLKSLYVDNNWITELPSWSDLIALEHLDISRNDIVKVPKGFVNTPNLRRLYMSDLKLDAGIDLRALSCMLDRLDVSGNPIDDLSFLEGQNLELLVMNRCSLDTLPNLFLMDRLSYLYITNNNISELPEYFGNLPLIRIDFSYNNITNLPQSFSRLSALEQLVFTGNYFWKLPDVVTKIKTLEVLMCGENMINDVPNNLAELSNVKRASFSGNELTTLYKFAGLVIPYSYQISIDQNYLDLGDDTNIEVLKRYHNDGGVQKTAKPQVSVASSWVDDFKIDLWFDASTLGSDFELADVKLYIIENDILDEQQCEFIKHDNSGASIIGSDLEAGTNSYLVCMVYEKTTERRQQMKYTATLNDIILEKKLVTSPTVVPVNTKEVASIIEDNKTEVVEKKNGNYLLYILIFGVIMIILAFILQKKPKAKRRKHKRR